MPFTPAKCTNCGASIQVPSDRRTASCMYCGTTLIVEEAIKMLGGADPKDILRVAFDFMDADNYEEADTQLTRVLEVDPDNSIYWLGKAAVRAFQGEMVEARTYFSKWSSEGTEPEICARASAWFVAAAHAKIGLPKDKSYPSSTILTGNTALGHLDTAASFGSIYQVLVDTVSQSILCLQHALECLQLAAAVEHNDPEMIGTRLVFITQIYSSIPHKVLSKIDNTEWKEEAEPLRKELVEWVTEACPEFANKLGSNGPRKGQQPNLPKSEKRMYIYVLLGLFLGVFGIHNFYAGYTGKAVAQLLITLFTGLLIIPLFIVLIWVFVEICSVNRDAQGRRFS